MGITRCLASVNSKLVHNWSRQPAQFDDDCRQTDGDCRECVLWVDDDTVRAEADSLGAVIVCEICDCLGRQTAALGHLHLFMWNKTL